MSGSAGARTRFTLVAVQLAFSLALIVAAGLLAGSTARIKGGHNLGVHHVLGLRLRPKLLEYPPQKARAFDLDAFFLSLHTNHFFVSHEIVKGYMESGLHGIFLAKTPGVTLELGENYLAKDCHPTSEVA